MIGITKYGRREVVVGTMFWIGLSAASCLLQWHWLPEDWQKALTGNLSARDFLAHFYWVYAVWAVLWVYLLAFFRNPGRTVPTGPGLLVAPADGRVTDITDLENVEFIDGPAVRIGIFMSLFSVHVNRSPADGVVEHIRHQPGRKVNAMRPDASQINENATIGLRDTVVGKLVVRQIAGLIAQRIVTDVALGQRLARGEIFGMIKFGSRAELIMPRKNGLLIAAKVGQKVRAGRDVLAQFTEVLANQSPPPGTQL